MTGFQPSALVNCQNRADAILRCRHSTENSEEPSNSFRRVEAVVVLRCFQWNEFKAGRNRSWAPAVRAESPACYSLGWSESASAGPGPFRHTPKGLKGRPTAGRTARTGRTGHALAGLGDSPHRRTWGCARRFASPQAVTSQAFSLKHGGLAPFHSTENSEEPLW